MSIQRYLTIGAISLFTVIGVAACFKKFIHLKQPTTASALKESPLERGETPVVSAESRAVAEEGEKTQNVPFSPTSADFNLETLQDDFPMVDRVFQLFTTGQSKLPIVETITYSSSVPWLKGRPAWIADYAAHYHTSRHFIARSLNGKADYFSQKAFEGSKFNVFRNDKQIQFYLLVDVSRLKMGLYYVDLNTKERVLLKTYRVSLGRLDPTKPSGTLTPLGRYQLGDKVAIYQPGTLSYFLDQKVEMIRVFGTRWIPFEQEIDRATASPKGYGLYGAPWSIDQSSGKWVEQRACIGKNDTDGGIRLLSEDVEEIFSIIISKPTFIEIVRDFRHAKLPGNEVSNPTR